MTVDSDAADISRGWGARPSTLQLIAHAASVAPAQTAFEGKSGPVPFAALNATVSMTAGVLAAQGIDTEAAVGAAVTGQLSLAGLAPNEIATTTSRVVEQIRTAAWALAGTSDWESLPGLFRSAAHRFADRVAVSASGRSLSYGELDARSDAVAAGLAARGVAAGDLVGIATARTVDLMSAILGVMKAGAGYLPLDLGNPVERLSFIVADAEVAVVIGDASSADHALWDRLPDGAMVVDVEALAAEPVASTDLVRVPADSRAYVIYTSGSTGRPKGVEITHRDVVTLIDAAADDFEFSASDVWTMFHSYAFDFSVWEMWGPLLSGARLVVIDRDLARDPRAFLDVLVTEQVTVLSQTPSAFYQLIDARRGDRRELALRYVVFGGEALSFDQVRRWYDENPSDTAQLVNMYGITETTVHVSFRALDRDSVAGTDASLIGRPLTSLGIHILDERLNPVPQGVPGEIYVTGGQLASGYLKRPGLSSSRFVANPFADDGSRMYRTGDRARRVGDDIEYLGRNDAQVQLRGFRIEFGEIEAALLAAMPEAAAAAARVIEDPDRGDQLVGYLVVAPGEDVDAAAVRSAMAAHVPGYMVPDAMVGVERLPLTANGKLDRKALPRPVFESGVEYVPPADDTERALVDVFTAVLGLEDISVTESVFDVGGNSLIAAQIVGRACEVLNVDLNMRDLFDAPTVRGLAARVKDAAPGLEPITPANPRPAVIPLSFSQQRMWFINQFDPTLPTYNIPVLLRITGHLDVQALRTAVVDVIARQDVLRTVFPAADGRPNQVILPLAQAESVLDWTVTDSPEVFESAVSAGFDVTEQMPIRVAVLRTDTDETILGVVVHHIAADGESMRPLVADLLTAYTSRVEHRAPDYAPLEVQFADYALWQHRVLGDATDPTSLVAGQLRFWTERLADLPDVIDLPTDRERPRVATNRGDQVAFDVPAEVVARVEDIARISGATPFMVAHAALAVLLSRVAATDDVAIATPIAGRTHAVVEPLVGMFVNTLVLRTGVDAGKSFLDFLEEVRAADLDAFANGDVPFETLVETLAPVRSEAFAPLAQVMLSFDPAQSAHKLDATIGGLQFTEIDPPVIPAQYDLTVGLHSLDSGGWSGTVTFATDLFDPSTAALIGRRFVRLLDALTSTPRMSVGDAPLISEDETSTVASLESGSPTIDSATFGGLGSLADGLSRAVSEHPERDALVFGDRTVSFGEFGARVWGLARELIAVGVGPDVAVAVVIPRSVELLVAVHAVVAAGGQYVPVDLDAPADRVEYMLATSGASLVLVAGGLPVPAAVAQVDGLSVREVDASGSFDAGVGPVSDADRRAPLSVDDALYTLFTSGSTGRPKGVTVSHRSVLNRLAWMDAWYPVSGSDRVLQKTPVTFDVSVWELFWPLVAGVPLVIAEPGRHGDPEYLREVIVDRSVSVVHFVPSMLSAFVDVLGDRLGGLTSLRYVFASGEALAPAVAGGLLSRLPGVGLHNLYGPTEAAVDVTAYSVRAGDAVVPIGSPVPKTVTRVLDSRLARVPVGVPGELYLGGVQVARGYAARPDLTAERFVADPFGGPGERLYRTGDLVRWNASGELEYLGRTDFQVKLRGQRLELGEVEAAVAAAPGVVHAAAVVAESGGGQQLVAYVAPADVDVDVVAESVASVLPGYMRPSVWVRLDVMPLTSSGKVDRKALPAPVFEAVEYVAPASDAEERVAAVFATLLDAERVSVTESFFDLGGNSLSAMRLVARVSDALGVQVGIRDVFDAPSVRDLVAAVADRRPALPPVSRVESRPERIPLSFAQQRMWFINQMEPELATYNIPAVFTLSGEVDVDLLRTATADVVARHEILRTTFPAVDGEPYQQIAAPADAAERLDWRVVASADELATDMRRGFDVAHEWPLRARVLLTGDGQATFALVAHHIAFDGQSFGPLATDLFAAYEARSRGAAPDFAPLDIQFADYALWQREVLGAPQDPDSVLGGQLAYWRDRLAGLPDVLELPADRPRPLVASHLGDVFTFDIPADIGRRVDAIATRHGATRFMVLHAAFAVLLARLTGTHDIAVGTPIGGRGQSELDAMVGMFVNTLVLRTEIDSASGFDAVLDRVRADDLDAFAHAEVPFESVVDAVNPVRSEAFSPLVQVILSVDPIGADVSGAATVNGLTVAPVDITEAPAQVDLNLTVSTGSADEDWSGILTYATDLFDRGTVEEMSRWFLRLLDGVLASEQTAVGDIRLLAAEQDQALLAGAIGPAASAADETIAELVGARVADSAQSLALVTGERTLTYGEFGLRVATVARTLIAEGVGPNTAVGVVMRRSACTVIAVHAIMAAGGQYVPIDPDTPADRARYMVETAGIGPVLVEKGHRPVEVLDVLDGRSPIIELDADAPLSADAAPLSASERLATLRLDDAAYTLFTSGSTGRPKGVTISHRAVANFVAWFDSLIPAGPQRLVFKTPHTFDASVLELFWPLTAGQTMVVADAEGHRDPNYLADLMAETGVTVAQFVPSLLSVFLDVVDRPDLLTGLQVLFSGGEALPPAVLRRFTERVPHARVVNLFGPTEAAVYTMSSALDEPVDVVPIGRPMPNTTAYVLDDRLHPVPDGVAGELYLGGVQSARGYAARPDLTAERFVADPFGAPGARLYRTGDLVRRRRTGDLDYLGRTDFQVKLRGQRLELGEVESAIADAPGVVHAAARVVAGPGGDQLVGYVAPATVDLDAVRTSLSDALAEYMRPTAWVLLDEMPLNSAGKVDRRSLPEPELEAAEYVAPASEAEDAIAGVFAGLLGVEQVSVTQSFFDLGGNSLSAMRLTSRVSDALGVEVTVRDVFDAPTVRELAEAVRGRRAPLPPVARPESRPGNVPLSFAQQRMWFINKFNPSSGMYNVPLVLRVDGGLDVAALRTAIGDVVARHESLRTTFPDVDGEPFQLVHDVSEIAERLDWREAHSASDIEDAVAAGFRLGLEWPVRARVWKTATDEHVVAVIMHHIASDRESFAPLVSDLVTAYSARSNGRTPAFAPLDVQYADFALWQRDVLGSPEDPDSVVGRQLAYWARQLAGVPDVLELPADRPRPTVASHRGAVVSVPLPAEVSLGIEELARRRGVTPFMVVHAALAVVLARLSATDDIAVATPIAGRGQQALEPVIGMFVNTLVLRTKVTSRGRFADLLDQVRSVDLEAFEHADVPFESVVERLQPVRSQAFAPLAQVVLSVIDRSVDLGAGVVDAVANDLAFTPLEPPVVPAQNDLSISVGTNRAGDGEVRVTYATDLFDEQSVSRFGERFVRVLAEVTTNPEMTIGGTRLLTDSERNQILEWSRGRRSVIGSPTLVHLTSPA
ncbi:non-ribosomal peptide synthetase [Gordonia sp. C13]|uniref:non-ribosomal peptide synthetase n=1 Tax=Gordonia sp. C13 TaxID=2935078 RepID=UPI00200B0AF1|nr:non-ribosomal peptide synthetase [Gordonia sp. C13]MCK8612926.1 amino acid adenylation domain-containing protein [Gordonia sp. C13]